MSDSPGTMKIRIEGPEVKSGRMEVTAFTDMVRGIYQGVKRVMLNSLEKKTARGARGRYPHELEESCKLAISGLEKGSLVVVLESIPPKQLQLTNDIDSAMEQFIDGINEIPKSTTVLPLGYDLVVISALESITGNLSKRGVERLTFTKQTNGKAHRAVIEPKLQAILSKFIKKTQKGEAKAEGKFYRIDLKQRTATLETFEGGTIPCHFDENAEMQIIEGLTHPVRVYGKEEKDVMTNRINRLDVKIIEHLPGRIKPEKIKHKQIKGKDPILALVGLGEEIWKGVDPDQYVQKLREGW